MEEYKPAILVAIAALIIVLVTWVGYSYFEAKSYNNVTGKNVSTFDAMFLELRVQESAK